MSWKGALRAPPHIPGAGGAPSDRLLPPPCAAAAAGMQRWLLSRAAAGYRWGLLPWVLGAAQAVTVAALLFLLASGRLPDPRAHALGATMAALVAYALVHVAVSGLMTLTAMLRRWTGRNSARRLVDLEVGRIWADYTAITTGLVLFVMVAVGQSAAG